MAAGIWNYKRTSTADEVLTGIELTGKKVVITGANSGIGYESARALAAAGASVVLACRNAQAAQAAADNIKAHHANAEVTCLSLDLASFDSIHSFSESLGGEALDILICNAGSMATGYMETE